MSEGQGVPGTGYRRVPMNPGTQKYRRPDGQIVDGSAGPNEEYRLRQKGFMPVEETYSVTTNTGSVTITKNSTGESIEMPAENVQIEDAPVKVEVPKGARRAIGKR